MRGLRVAVAMSGGVDSSVAAALLKDAGYDIVGVFLTCWSKGIGCSTETDRMDALRVAVKLGIPFRVFNFEKEYKERVIDRFFEAYKKGLTPNPDIWCNEEIKFGLFLEKALSELKVDCIATGHYARIKLKTQNSKLKTLHLLMGVDKNKDQSYFLYRLTKFQLSKTLFPIGSLTKQLVREIAKEKGLHNAEKPDSQGICFIGNINVNEFLKRRLPIKQGEVVRTNDEVIGVHDGVWFYTIGQRHGFKINKYQGQPLYVIEKDVKNNRLIVGRGKESEVKSFAMGDLHWIYENEKPARPAGGLKIKNEKLRVRIRHLGELMPCRLETGDSEAQVELENPTRGVAPGQHAVFYQGEEVLGGGVIEIGY